MRLVTTLLLCALTGGPHLVHAVPMAGLRAWYPFEGNTLDASGNGRNGSGQQLGYLPGHSGQAALFNGDSSYMGLPVNLPGGDWTICGWGQVEALNETWTDRQLFVATFPLGFGVGVDTWAGGKLTLWAGGLVAQDPAHLPLHTSFSWLFERQGNTGRIWRDGQIVAEGTCTFSPSFLRSVGQWIAGGATPYDRRPMNGWLDEICVYDRALSPEEKAELLGGGTVEAQETPLAFGLLQAMPNPFNPTTEIRFSLADPAEVTVRVLDLLGREVALLHEGWLSRGEQRLRFQAEGLASGIYFCDVATADRHQAIKLTLLR